MKTENNSREKAVLQAEKRKDEIKAKINALQEQIDIKRQVTSVISINPLLSCILYYFLFICFCPYIYQEEEKRKKEERQKALEEARKEEERKQREEEEKRRKLQEEEERKKSEERRKEQERKVGICM